MKFLDRVRAWLQKKPGEPMGSFTRDDGSPCMMDRLTAEVLVSELPCPTQAAIDALAIRVTRVRFIKGGCGSRPLGTEVALDLQEVDDVRQFLAFLRIVEDASTFGHCMCLGDYAVELSHGEAPPAYLGFHHGAAIRWNGVWRWDARLAAPEPLLKWLAGHGLQEPWAEWEAQKDRAERSRQQAAAWIEAAPSCVRPLGQRLLCDFPQAEDVEVILEALEQGETSPEARVRGLFRWYATCGSETWNGYPVYEALVERVLLRFPLDTLYSVEANLDEEEAEGACRFFLQGQWLNTAAPRVSRIPLALRDLLLAHVERTRADSPFETQARYVFGGQMAADWERVRLTAPPELRPVLESAVLGRTECHELVQRVQEMAPGCRSELIRHMMLWSAGPPIGGVTGLARWTLRHLPARQLEEAFGESPEPALSSAMTACLEWVPGPQAAELSELQGSPLHALWEEVQGARRTPGAQAAMKKT